ncbi:MAG: DUF1343 domain-containing protein [Bacteroidetes bacterium]|nr:DUF1343 domain-containing protein [Bacteroidota bacterium]
MKPLIKDSGTTMLVVLVFMLLPVVLHARIRTGAERTELYYPLLKGKNIGVVANQASVVDGSSIVDILVRQGFHVVRIFSPEHGFRISGEAGQIIGNSVDSATGIPVVSLYGSKKKPAPEDMQSLDLVLFDIQDVGVRFYTYISTLSYVMEACAAADIPMILLDRPNPNGYYVDGPVLEKQFSSFVGMHPVPVVYGMTIGEYARMVNGEGWLKNRMKCDLRVIQLENYTGGSRCVLTEKPSPNLPCPEAVSLYPSLCFFEGTPVSVGRGTAFPFQVYGHPELSYGTFSFTPESITGASGHPPQEGKICHGEDLRKYYQENPGEAGRITLKWLIKAFHGWNGKTAFFTDYFNKLAGNATLQKQIIEGKSETEIRQSWKPAIGKFKKIRKKYLLY